MNTAHTKYTWITIAAVAALLAFYLYHAQSEWQARGCSKSRAAELAIKNGQPEFGEYCKRGQ